MKESQGKTVYLRDYRVPDFLIDETRLIVELFETETLVTSRLKIRSNPAANSPQAPLVLNGRAMELLEVKVAGKTLKGSDYVVDSDHLTIADVPGNFLFECRTRIKPQENTSLEGLYKSRVMFCTQCEAEGFRKITYYLDRPDVLSKIGRAHV
mgnify:CR=1 FL=1